MRALITSCLLSALMACTGAPMYFASPEGGQHQAGAVYQVRGHVRTVLYNFCPRPEFGCPDGSAPLSNVIPMADGSLIGATATGGAGYNGGQPAGVLFRLQPLSDGSWSETVLYNFCPFFDDCGHYGAPAAISLVDQDTVEGIIQTADGGKGVWWRFKLSATGDGGVWSRIQNWWSK